jgi:hypothetical protein
MLFHGCISSDGPQTLSAAVKSIEDHGYQLDMGIPDVAGFLPFKDVKRDSAGKLHVGQILDVVVVKMSSNARTCKVVLDKELFASATVSQALICDVFILMVWFADVGSGQHHISAPGNARGFARNRCPTSRAQSSGFGIL